AGQLGQKVAALDKASDLLPPVVRRAIGLRVAILVRVKPGDPGLGDELLRDLGELEKAFGASGTKLLVEFGAKLAEALKAVEKDDAPAGQRCAACGAELKGERYCLSCYDERWSSAL
ncbi:MAG: hypothetical protein NTW87_13010, partial [Planctomycetota bacterium]|nr:hypothetical protein [Planctomycetota bacterium]